MTIFNVTFTVEDVQFLLLFYYGLYLNTKRLWKKWGLIA